MLSPSAKLNIILVLVMFINFLIVLYRRGVWRNIWRGSMLQSIGCLTSLVEHLYVCLKFFNHLLVTASAVLSHILFLFLLSRHPSLHLVPTKPGSACLWSLSSGTGWSMLWPIVKLFQSWCSVKLWLMARSGLTRHIHLDSWVRCMPDHNFGFMITMLWPLLAPDSIISYIFPADVVSIPKTGENFRLLYDTKGRFRLHSIRDDEAKVCIHHWLRSRSGFCMLFMLPCSQTTST